MVSHTQAHIQAVGLLWLCDLPSCTKVYESLGYCAFVASHLVSPRLKKIRKSTVFSTAIACDTQNSSVRKQN